MSRTSTISIARHLLEGSAEHLIDIGLVAGKQLAISSRHTLGRVQQALALRVVSRPAQQHANGGLRFFAARAAGIGYQVLYDCVHAPDLPFTRLRGSLLGFLGL